MPLTPILGRSSGILFPSPSWILWVCVSFMLLPRAHPGAETFLEQGEENPSPPLSASPPSGGDFPPWGARSALKSSWRLLGPCGPRSLGSPKWWEPLTQPLRAQLHFTPCVKTSSCRGHPYCSRKFQLIAQEVKLWYSNEWFGLRPRTADSSSWTPKPRHVIADP